MPKQRLVLDTNCIIDLEEERVDAKYLKQLIALWQSGETSLAVVAVSASENQPGGGVSKSFTVFEEKLTAAGLAGATKLYPLGVWDVSYWDHALWSGEDLERLLHQVKQLLFPGMELDAPNGEKEKRVWRNALCDIMVAWCCIYHGWKTLVTRDTNFHNKKTDLKTLGIEYVLQPEEAVALFRPQPNHAKY